MCKEKLHLGGSDLAQEALAKAWRSRRSFAPGTNLKAWLCIILRNGFYSYRRRSWRQVPWDPELASTIPAPAGEQQWAVELSDTAHAMHGLTDVQREALMLVGVSGFSYVDAALLMGSTLGTTKSRVARARKLLSDILDGRSSLPSPMLDAGAPAGTAVNRSSRRMRRRFAPSTPSPRRR